MTARDFLLRLGNWGALRGRVVKRETPPLTRLRKLIGLKLERMSHWVSPELNCPRKLTVHLNECFKLPGATRTDFNLLTQGTVTVRYRALDPVWHDKDCSRGMIGLYEHVRRCWMATSEFATWEKGDGWEAVERNLHLAASLTDVFADTDLDGASMWCSPVADYEIENEEVTVKHLAGLLVFNLVWTAYECAVEAAGKGVAKGSRGARGRELLSQLLQAQHFPHLKTVLYDALDITVQRTDLRRPEMRRALEGSLWAAAAAEHLRQFRNKIVHGDVGKPNLEDRGDERRFLADDDPAICQFPAYIRLTLMLIPMWAGTALDDTDELTAWFRDAQPARRIFTQLHCSPMHYEGQLDLFPNDQFLPDSAPLPIS